MWRTWKPLQPGTGLCVLLAVIVSTAGCSGGGNQTDDSPTGDASTQQTASPGSGKTSTLAPMRSRPPRDALASAEGDGVRAEVNKVVANDVGFVVVYWTLINTGENELSVHELFGKRNYSGAAYFSEQFPWYLTDNMEGVEVVLSEERYLPITDPGSNCVCSTTTLDVAFLPSGKSIEAYSAYYLPRDVESVSVSFPGLDLMEDIPVTHREGAGATPTDGPS